MDLKLLGQRVAQQLSASQPEHRPATPEGEAVPLAAMNQLREERVKAETAMKDELASLKEAVTGVTIFKKRAEGEVGSTVVLYSDILIVKKYLF